MKPHKLLVTILFIPFLLTTTGNVEARRAYDSYNLTPEERARILRQARSGHSYRNTHKRKRKRKPNKSFRHPRDESNYFGSPSNLQKSQKQSLHPEKSGLTKRRKEMIKNALYIDPFRSKHREKSNLKRLYGLSELKDPHPPLSIDKEPVLVNTKKVDTTSKTKIK